LSSKSSSLKQQYRRQGLRFQDCKEWPSSFMIFPYQRVAFELCDSALDFEHLCVRWKYVLSFSIPLRHYIDFLPFGFFILPTSKNEKPCHLSNRSGIIPPEWQAKGWCDRCFPPRDKKQFLFALHVIPSSASSPSHSSSSTSSKSNV
jgi:hypothetical protein